MSKIQVAIPFCVFDGNVDLNFKELGLNEFQPFLKLSLQCFAVCSASVVQSINQTQLFFFHFPQIFVIFQNQYSALSRDDIEDWMDVVQNHIQRKGREIKHADFSKIQLSLPAVELDERVVLVFDAVSPKIKLDWINALETAKLGLGKSIKHF